MVNPTTIVLSALVLSAAFVVSAGKHAIDLPPDSEPSQAEAEEQSKYDESLRPLHPYDWHNYRRLAEVIGTAAEWPAARQMTDDEWQSVIRVAVALQNMHPDDVQTALVAYMILQHEGKHGSIGCSKTCPEPSDTGALSTQSERSGDHDGFRPMLIFRVMFEVPEDEPPAKDGVLPCGGYPCKPVDPNAIRSPAFPVTWTEDGPRISAFLPAGGWGIGGGAYSPRREYLKMLTNYEYREGLGDYLDIEVRNWRHIWLMQRGKWPREND